MLLTGVGCGKNYNGTFTGSETVYITSASGDIDSYTTTMTVTLKHESGLLGNSDSVTGDWTTTRGGIGSLTGTIESGIIKPVTVIETRGCRGTYEGSAFFDPDQSDNNTLKGSAEGRTSECGKVSSFFTLLRTSE